MPSCNGADRDGNIIPRESGQTSSWCLITREFGEPPYRGKAANYHSHVVAKETFARNDARIWSLLWQWATRTHPNKSAKWVKANYFQARGARHGVFAAHETRGDGTLQGVVLLKESDTSIQRHVKIKSDANPHDPKWAQYFETRWGKKMLNSARGRKKLYRVWLKQDGTCPVCQERIAKDSPWTVQHLSLIHI